jgi:hypothetical protein
MEVCLKTLFAKEREQWHTCKATGDKKDTILPRYHSGKQLSGHIARGSENIICHIRFWSFIGNLGGRVKVLSIVGGVILLNSGFSGTAFVLLL